VKHKTVLLVIALAAVVVAGTVGVWAAVQSRGVSALPETAARTSFPELTPASGAPVLPSLATLSPAPGAVMEAAGPFDDRFHFRELTFDGRRVVGTAEITSDVSDVLEFETVAGFYDHTGTLLGSGRHTFHLDESESDHAHEGVPDQKQHFEIAVPAALRGKAVAAAVGVPVLVNE
jgi:hypothetical protein